MSPPDKRTPPGKGGVEGHGSGRSREHTPAEQHPQVDDDRIDPLVQWFALGARARLFEHKRRRR